MSDIAIYWFRDDLRLNDLAGLSAAAERGPVVALYIWDEKVSEEWRIGSASRWWLHKSLAALEAALTEQGIPLTLRSGNTATVLEEVCRSVNAKGAYCSRQYPRHSFRAQHVSIIALPSLRQHLSSTSLARSASE